MFASAALPQEVHIGVLAYRGPEQAVASWQPTIDYLNKVLPDYRFSLRPLTLSDMHAAVEADDLAFVLTNPGNYVDLEVAFGVSRIATLESIRGLQPEGSIGSTIIVRSDRHDINSLTDLRGKSFMAVSPQAFGGFQIAWRELKQHDIDPRKDFSALRFMGFPLDQIVYAVRDGKVDAGSVRVCLLERLSAEGRISLGDFKILNLQDNTHLGCALSSRLYPDWPFATTRATSPLLAKQVATALLGIHRDTPAARAGRYLGWTVPVDYQPVHELFRELEIGPYQRRGGLLSLQELWERYWHWLVILLVGVLWIIFHMARVEYLVKVRTAQLTDANARLRDEMTERERAEEKVLQHQQALAHVSRVSTMGELASGLAHELNQPLSAISNYVQGCAWRLKEGTLELPEMLRINRDIARQAERASAIIQRLRTFLRDKTVECSELDINAAIAEALALYATEARRMGVKVELDLAPELPRVCAESIQLQQVVLNLLSNAAEAMREVPPLLRVMTLSTRLQGDRVFVSVCDQGRGLGGKTQAQLFEPFYTTRPDGMGMGLSICRSMIEAQGGELSISPNSGTGVTVSFDVPVYTG